MLNLFNVTAFQCLTYLISPNSRTMLNLFNFTALLSVNVKSPHNLNHLRVNCNFIFKKRSIKKVKSIKVC